MLRAPEDEGGKQGILPGTGGDADDAAKKAADAEKRAKDAERRAEAAEKREQERKEKEEADERNRSIKTTEDAKKAAADAEKRAKDAERRAEAAEKRIRDRIDERFQTLDSETRTKLEPFRSDLSIDRWEQLVDLEVSRMGGNRDTDDSNRGGTPPAQPAGAGRRNHGKDGRELHPKSVEILDELGVETDAARKVLEVETETEGGVKRGRFVYPPKKLKKHLKERALKPVLMDDETRRKMLGL